jgi:hypothetical protein
MSTYNREYKEVLKQIKNDKSFYTSNGNLNSAYFRRDHFLVSTLCKNIINCTNFLDNSDPLSKRIYCIINNLTDTPKCICEKPLKFISNKVGFIESCNKCFRKVNTTWKSPSGTCNFNIKKEKQDLIDYLLNEETEISSKEEMIEFLSEKNDNTAECVKCVSRTDMKNSKHILKRIIKETNYMILTKNKYNWANRFYNIIYDTHNGKICFVCNKNKTRFINLKQGYTTCCPERECAQFFLCKNRVTNHIENIAPMIESQGFVITDKTNFNGLNYGKTKLMCNVCNTSIECDISDGKWKNIRCYVCYGKNGTSYQEKTVLAYVKQYESNILENYKYTNTNKELDIYIPSKNIAIEYNGGLWHSFGSSFPNNIDQETEKRNNHFAKYKECLNLNINLLQINSHEWNNVNKQNIWKSIINNKLGNSNKIYARKCRIVELYNKQKNDFLNTNHLQGMDNSKIKLGLEYNGDIVSVMTFSKPRFNKNYQWELVRFCNKLNHNVIGGASKLLSHFKKSQNPKSLISYADLRYSNGNMYKKLGFVFKTYTPPSYVYTKGDKILSRFSSQKHRLAKILENFDENKTENQNMMDNSYRKLWDAGTMLFVYSK